MRFAVTGSHGFLGRCLVAGLRAASNHVTTIDLLDDPPRDVRHMEDLVGAFNGADTLFHLAADNSSTAKFYSDPEWIMEVGARGILNVITEAKRAGVKTLVVASSAEAYGSPIHIPTTEREPLKVSDPTNPRFAYAASKIMTEVAALTCGGFERVIVFRPHNIYGPGQQRGHVIPDLLDQVGNGEPMVVKGHRDQTRAFCHVNDAIDGILYLWKHGKSGVYHIGTSEETSLAELVRLINGNKPVVWEAPPKGSPARRCPSIHKMKRLGWAPRIPLKWGIADLMKWPPNQQ